MQTLLSRSALAVVAGTMLVAASPAQAQEPALEIGTTLTSVTIGLGDNDTTVVGIPSSSFGLLNPGVYASIFAGSKVSFEPQLGLIWASSDGESFHFLNAGAQVNYFPGGPRGVYVFGTASIIDASDESANPKAVGGGAGYRIAVGDRLAFRLDGRYLHFTQNGGNALAFGLSIGGVFNR